MIDVHKAESDDPEFLEVVAKFVEGLGRGEATQRLHLIHIDDGFDHKWVQFSGKPVGSWRGLTAFLERWSSDEDMHLTLPPFHPNRVISHQRFDNVDGELKTGPKPKAVHLKIRSGKNVHRRISELIGTSALVWYTGKTVTNRRGAIMAYVPTEFGYDTWYVSLSAGDSWSVQKAKGIAKPVFLELLSRAG